MPAGRRSPARSSWAAGSRSISACSSAAVLASEICVRNPVSKPSAIATTRGEHSDAEAAPDPFAGAERALHRREHAPADEQRERQRRRGAGA